MAAIVAVLAPAAALGSFRGEDGVIAYSVGQSLQRGIWALNPSTGYQLQLTSGPDEAPSFSASGNMLAFQRRAAGTVTIYIARADGSDAKPLVSGSEPAFSPDDQRIVFVRASGLFLTGVAPGSRAQQITRHPGDRTPRWSSTGEIVFQRTDISHVRRRGVSERRTREALAIITPPSLRTSEALSYQPHVEMWPEWSPNGRTLAVALCTGSPPPHGLPATVPSFVFHSDCLPQVWAPDGRRLVGSAEQAVEPGLAWGGPETSCPRYIPQGTDVSYFRNEVPEPTSPAEISWQPLLSGTMRLPTVTCEPRPEPGVIHSAVAPATSGPGAQLCIPPTRRHRHRRCV